jgi:outer membrane receptor protein involved in Fe transport
VPDTRIHRAIFVGASFCAVLAMSQAAWCEDRPPPEDSEAPPKKLEKIEVQGPNEVDERRASTAAKIVVSHDDLVKYGDSTLLDAVKRLPGITVESDGRGGGTIKMRGLGAGYTQILLDGEPVPPGFSIETLSPDQIERIEIFRSATAEFSTGAIAGTINIVLRKVVSHRRRELRLGASLANGEVSTRASGELSDRAGSLSYTLPVSLVTFRFRSASVAEQRGQDAAGVPNLDYVTDSPGRGSGGALDLSPKLAWNLGKDHSLTWDSFLHAVRFRGEFDERSTTFLGAPPTYASDNLAYTSSGATLNNSLSWSRRLENDARIEAKLGLNYNHRSTTAIFDGFDDAGTFTLHRTVDGHFTDDGVTLKGKYTFPLVTGHDFVAGWDGERSRRTEDRLQLDATPDGTTTADIDESYDARVTRLALFAQDDWEITSRVSLYAGLRWEGIDTSSTGNTFADVKTRSGVWSPIVQTLWKLPGSEKDQVRAGLARTYKAPGTFELMPRRYIANNNSATTPDFQGNPDLQPELAWGLDLAYEHYFKGGGLFSASAYERRIDGVILRELLDVNGTFITRPANEGRAQVKGIELDTKFDLANLFAGAPSVDVHANVSHHWSSVDYLPGPDNRLAQQTRWSANLGLDYKLASKPLTIGGNYGFRTGGPVRVSLTQTAYTSASRNLDLYGLWKISPAAELRIYANNLLPRDSLRIDDFADDSGSLELTTIGPAYRTYGFTVQLRY